jgi:hypothetical protein
MRRVEPEHPEDWPTLPTGAAVWQHNDDTAWVGFAWATRATLENPDRQASFLREHAAARVEAAAADGFPDLYWSTTVFAADPTYGPNVEVAKESTVARVVWFEGKPKEPAGADQDPAGPSMSLEQAGVILATLTPRQDEAVKALQHHIIPPVVDHAVKLTVGTLRTAFTAMKDAGQQPSWHGVFFALDAADQVVADLQAEDAAAGVAPVTI